MDADLKWLQEISRLHGWEAAGRIAARVETLTAELEALRRDAARYAWIKANATVETDQWVYWHDEPECTDLDKRIDAAIGQTVALVPVPVKEG